MPDDVNDMYDDMHDDTYEDMHNGLMHDETYHDMHGTMYGSMYVRRHCIPAPSSDSVMQNFRTFGVDSDFSSWRVMAYRVMAYMSYGL